MEYRINKKTGDKISEIGFGSAYICEAGLDEAVRTLRRAYEGGINYYDLATVGDSLAVEHYMTLEKNAADCISCGHCDSRCPFDVKQSTRMKEIAEYMASV